MVSRDTSNAHSLGKPKMGIVARMELYAKNHEQLNAKTISRYQQMSLDQQEQLISWLRQNLLTLPMPAKTKKQGIKDLLEGRLDSNLGLLMLRAAMQSSEFKLAEG